MTAPSVSTSKHAGLGIQKPSQWRTQVIITVDRASRVSWNLHAEFETASYTPDALIASSTKHNLPQTQGSGFRADLANVGSCEAGGALLDSSLGVF